MNEELILRVMFENRMTRDQAIAFIIGNQNTLNPVESQFSSSYTGFPTNVGTTPFQMTYPSPQNTSFLNNNVGAPTFSQENMVISEPLYTINPTVPSYPQTTQIDPTAPKGEIIGTQRINWENLMQSREMMPQNYRGDFQPMTIDSTQPNAPRADVLPNVGTEVALREVEPVSQTNNNRDLNTIEQMSIFASQLNPYGSDLETELYSLGRGIGRATSGQGGTANTLGIVGSAGAALLGGTRSALSGYSTQIANNRYLEWMRERQRRQQNQYTPNSQTQNTQATALGGITQS